MMKAALVLGGELCDWDGSMGHCAGEVQSPSSPMKSSSRFAQPTASEKRERNPGVVLEMPVGVVLKQGNGKHKVVVGRMQEGSPGTFKLRRSLGSCHSHRLGQQC